ncbi:MAG: AarF/ABC1/UbiB kinase family protein [Thermonemataceae bacterium]|nr:AarF/ABC1/UbiB kinase family protein [Thermonemataceae bacterium]
MFFGQTIRNLKRIREITNILLKYGFEGLVANTPLKAIIPARRRLARLRGEKIVEKYSTAELARMAAEELGPTFVKLAQILANRPDIIPEEYQHEFEKLQSQVAPFHTEIAKKIIEEELKKPLSEIFLEFSEKPIGSASIGQVHLARLLDGQEVVIKIQRPDVAKKVMTDLAIIKDIVKRGDNFFKQQGLYNIMDIVVAFEKSIKKELDYTNEARYIDQFRNYYKDYKNFYVPRAFLEYTTRKVMILEFVKGCKITDVNQLKKWGLDPTKIAEAGMDIYLTQIFQHGYFHADPHPGNILIQESGRICLIDFGMVGKLTKSDRFAFAGVLIAMAQQNPKEMARNFRKLAIESEIEDDKVFEAALGELIDDFVTLDVNQSSMSDMAARLQEIIRDFRLQVPGGVFIILRALTILEGIGKTIHPTFQTYDFFKPYGVKIFLDQYSPKNLGEELLNTSRSFVGFLSDFPREVREILHKLRKGRLHIETHFMGYEPAIHNITKAVRFLALSILIVGLLITAAMMAQTELRSLSTFSIITFSLAVLLMSVLLFKSLFSDD